MKWISVKDWLPDKYEKVLVTDGNQVCWHYKQSFIDDEDLPGRDLYRLPNGMKDFSGKWVDCCNIEPGSITHWTPLPEAPK